MYHCTTLAKNRKSLNKRIINFRVTLILACIQFLIRLCTNANTAYSYGISLCSGIYRSFTTTTVPVYELHIPPRTQMTSDQKLFVFFLGRRETIYYSRESTSVRTGIDILVLEYTGSRTIILCTFY